MSQQFDVADAARYRATSSGGGAGPSSASRDQRAHAEASGHAVARHGVLWWLFLAAGWLTVLVLLTFAVLRVFDHDGSYFLISVNAFTRYLYLPAYAVLAWAAWQRRWLLAAASLAVVLGHVTWLAPDFLRDRRFDVAAANAPASAAAPSAHDKSKTIRIFFANVCADNPDPGAFLEEIPKWNPDLVVFVEFYHHWHNVVSLHPALQPYRYGTGRSIPWVTEVGLFSKLPISKPKQLWTAGRLNLAVDVDVDGVPLRLFALHSPRPIELPMHDYNRFWSTTIPQVLGQPEPAVVVGDFNATQYSQVYQTLTADRFRSAHADRGRGWATTWPNGEDPLPPIRIDQALLSPGVECLDITEGRGLGSDHKPLILDVRLRPTADATQPANAAK